MDDELRMKLSDLGSPEALAACIVSYFPDIEVPIPLTPVAEAVGIVQIIGQQTSSFEGLLVTNSAKSTGSIAYNEASRPERRRFTIAHELGHFVMPLHGANAQCAKADMRVLTTQDPNRAREAEANRFAAALLMPRELFIRDIRRLGAPEVEHVVKLAGDYGVSKEAAVRRYTDLCDDPCAVIFSQNGVAGHIYRTGSFPAISIRKDHPLPRHCMSAQGKSEPGQVSDCSKTAPELWLANVRRLRGATLYEQFLDQANGYRMTMLTIDGALDDDDDPDEEEELEESWTPRFRK
jgi:Zn-dependent peptidase ImmA (M78 family)